MAKEVVRTTVDLEPHLQRVLRRFLLIGVDLNECERVLTDLRSMDEWSLRWSESGARWEEKTLEAMNRQKPISARDFCLQAFFAYRLAGFVLTEDTPHRRQTYEKAVGAFREAIRLGAEATEPVEIPFQQGSLPAYLTVPDGRDRQVPVVIYITGADGCKEDQFFASAKALAQRGLASVLFDGPGQGESLRLRGLFARPDYEVVITAIVNYLENRPEIDRTKIGLVGSSMGGYYGPRAAAFEKRIKACICFSALFDVVEGLFDPYPPIRPAMRDNIGAKTIEEARQQYLSFTLKHVVDRIECPCLIVHGGQDALIPVSEAHRLFDALKAPKELKIWDDGRHNCVNYFLEARAFMWDWLVDELV